MESPIRILHLEDNLRDSELIQAHLESEGVPCELVRVETQADFLDKMEAGGFDLVLSDYSVLGFDGMSALALLKQRFPEVPFILVTGTLGEERAVESLKTGASDFVLKGNLTRLAPAVRRALKEAEDEAQRQKAEEALRREKTFTDAVVDSVPGLFYLFDNEGNLLRWNRQFEEISGYSAKEVAQKKLLDWIAQEDKAQVASAVQKVFVEGLAEAEAHLVTRGDEKIPFYFTGVRLTAHDRMYLVGVGIDLTSRKRAEQAVRESEERYRAIMEQSADGIFLTDPETRCLVEANTAFQRLLGYTPEKIPGLSIYDLAVAPPGGHRSSLQ